MAATTASKRAKPTRRKARGWDRVWQLTWIRQAVQVYFVLFIAKVAIKKAIDGLFPHYGLLCWCHCC
ncbi:MAG: hypothetical protein M1358_19770 [Chloroflexi bacterium]|nr:hypothetical protein [Chloroflexota bacterium]